LHNRNNFKINFDFIKVLLFFTFLNFFCVFIGNIFAQTKTVELNGDVLNYSLSGNSILAEGNVEVLKEGTVLLCDKVEFFQDTNIAKAEGNVSLTSGQGKITGDKLTFNFETMQGDFREAKIFSHPYYGYAEKVSKVSENEINMFDGYITTSDYDVPEYRLKSRKIEVYPQDKIVARNIFWCLGDVPVLYIPKMVQSLKDKKPRVILTPGYNKEWGMFLLSQWRYYFSENFKGTIRVDAREKKDIATGVDLKYKIEDFGEGVIYTYYMNERNITSKRFYMERPSPTIEKERFKIVWRHKWNIDEKTDTIWQYYKLSDSSLNKDYFEREYDKDISPSTYFLLTRRLPNATMSFQIDPRVNRFNAAVERLPEISYSFANKEIGDTNFYFRNTTTYSNLVSKAASPSEIRQKTHRLYFDNRVSYQKKIGFIEFRPYVGGSHTYYSRVKDIEKDYAIRGAFNTGASLSTQFYKVFDTSFNKFGINGDKFRHVVGPSVSYNYAHDPTVFSSELNSFDGIDSLSRSHSLTFALENKLQMKKDNVSSDLLRFIIDTDFRLKEHPSKGGFENIETELSFTPADHFAFRSDTLYETRKDRMTSANFSFYLKGKDEKWEWNLSKRWHREADDQVTTSLDWKINPLWAISMYERFDLKNVTQKEQIFAVTRDLHSWIMDISFSEKRGEGSEILIVFTLKAFPDIGFDFGSSFNKRKINSQSP